MCLSFVVGTLLSVAGSAMGAMATSAAAKGQANQVEYQMAMQNKQLEEEKQMTRLKAQQQEAERLAQLSELRSKNQAYLASSGVDENISYLEGIDKWSERQTGRDLGTLNLNQAYQTSRIADQISVNSAQSQFARDKAKLESQAGWIKAGTSIASDVGSRYRASDYYAINKGSLLR